MQLRRATVAALLAVQATHAAINVYERPAAPGPAPGTCQIIKEGEAELYLCIKKVEKTAGDRQVVEGFIKNGGKKALCDIKVTPVGVTGTVENFWPDWVIADAAPTDEPPKLIGGQESDVGMTILLDNEGKVGTPTIGAVSFKVCDGTDAMNPETTHLKVKKISEVKHKVGNGGSEKKKDGKKGKDGKAPAPGADAGAAPGATPGAAPGDEPLQPAAEEPKAGAAPANGASPAAPAQPANKMIEIVEDEISSGPAPGECFYYHEGTAEVLLCTKTSEAAGDRVKLVSGLLFNNGTTDLCDIKLEPVGVDATAVQSVWPDWGADAAAGKDPFIFGAHQTVDIGLTASATADQQPGILLASFKVCGGTDELKKDTIAYTVPLESINLDLSNTKTAAKKGKVVKGKAGDAKGKKGAAAAAAAPEPEPVAQEVGDAAPAPADGAAAPAPADGAAAPAPADAGAAAPATPEAPLQPATEEPATAPKKAAKKTPAKGAHLRRL